MAGIRLIEHKGKKILYEDYSSTGPGTIDPLLEEAAKIIRSSPEKSVLALVNVSGAKFNPEVSAKMKEFVKLNTPYIKVSAIVGMSGLQSVIYRAILAFTGRTNLKVFGSEQEAKEFLAGF